MIDYNTIRAGDTIVPDEHLRALIRARYGEYASPSYVVIDRGTLQGRTKVHTKITRTILDDGTVLPDKTVEWEEREWARPLLLGKGSGQNRKASLDWSEIKAFRPTPKQITASRPPVKQTPRGDLIIRREALVGQAKQILESLGLDASAIS